MAGISFVRFAVVRRWIAPIPVAMGSPRQGLQSPGGGLGQFGRNRRRQTRQSDEILGCFSIVISPPTARFDLQNLYRVEEEEEEKKMGQVSWPEVAGRRRNRPVKPAGTVARGERNRVRRERADLGFPEMETLNPKLAIYSKFSTTFADHNFSIRTPILAYFVSTNSI